MPSSKKHSYSAIPGICPFITAIIENGGLDSQDLREGHPNDSSIALLGYDGVLSLPMPCSLLKQVQE